jgi:hypothetical protein
VARDGQAWGRIGDGSSHESTDASSNVSVSRIMRSATSHQLRWWSSGSRSRVRAATRRCTDSAFSLAATSE